MRCLVVDSDPLVCETIESFLERIDDVEPCLQARDGATAISLLSSGRIDAAFIDLELPGLDGAPLIKSLPPNLPAVAISTSGKPGAHFSEFNIVGCLGTPIAFPRFYHVVKKLQKRVACDSVTGDAAPVVVASPDRSREVFVKDGTRIVRVNLDNLQLLKAESNYVEFISTDSSVLVLTSMKRIGGVLPDDFIRIHRSYFINRNHLVKIEDGWAFVGKHRVPVSQRYRNEVVKRLRIIN